MRNARDEALEMVEEGLVMANDMLMMALSYMSTDEVADMLDANELSERFREDFFENDDDNALEEDF